MAYVWRVVGTWEELEGGRRQVQSGMNHRLLLTDRRPIYSNDQRVPENWAAKLPVIQATSILEDLELEAVYFIIYRRMRMSKPRNAIQWHFFFHMYLIWNSSELRSFISFTSFVLVPL